MPKHVAADFARFDKVLAPFIRTSGDFTYIDASAPKDVTDAYGRFVSMCYANGWI